MFTPKNLFDLEKTIVKELFGSVEYAWEVLPKIKDFILKIGPQLPKEKFKNIKENVWIANDAKIFESAYIDGPTIICSGAQVRHSAFIRGCAIVGNEAVVGNSTEIKNSILFDGVQVSHYNYVGDSVLGYKAHFGAGAITSNVKSDRMPVKVKSDLNDIDTGLKKFGAMVGDYVEIGCNTVLNPGTIIGRNSSVYPLSSVRGFVPEMSIYKAQNKIVKKY